MSLLLVALVALVAVVAPVAVVAQNPVSAARDTVSGISFTRPAGWFRQELDNGSVGFVPPGADAERFTMIVMASQASDLAHEVAHRELFDWMTSGSQVQGPVEPSRVAGWLRSEARVVSAEGTPLWTAVYTFQQDGRLELVMAMGLTETVYRLYRPTVEQALAGATLIPVSPPMGMPVENPRTTVPAAAPVTTSAAGVRIHGLVIPYPSTWSRQDDPTGAVMLVPNQLPGTQAYFLTVLPPVPKSGTHWETHKAILAEVLAQVPWTDAPVTNDYPDGPGPFIRTGIAGHIPGGGMQQIELYTAAHGDTVETVVGLHGIDRNVTDPVLRAVSFTDPAGPGERPRIVEAYRRINQRLYADLQAGVPTAGGVVYERIWLRADGVADFSTTYPEGYAASSLPFKVDASLLNGDFGSWRAVGDQVHIVRRAGVPPVVYRREDGGLRDGDSWWEPMPRVDDLKLSGRWSIRSAPTDTFSPYYDWIEFTPDGRFTTSGVFPRISLGMDDRPRPPDPASGAYRIKDWTMFFTFPDGSTWSTDFSTLGPDPASFTAILFRTYVYPRER